MKYLVSIAVGILVVFAIWFFPFMMFNPDFLTGQHTYEVGQNMTHYLK